ncbi:YdaU family protein [Robbsia andropogonis]|uniref:YdaU family protein n=1 Tax=Robbsia andropogonis TaxID=28092 RepID=UPI00046678CD|nr:YdaU family protein [Robbsia andropogonis]
MHYYDHNIGDYRKDTGHLTLLEHGIYRSLLDTYYLDEKPLTLDHAKLMRSHSVRTADEVQSFENVLQDFFERTEDGYAHKRCEAVITKYHAKGEKARESAKARWAKEKALLDAKAMRTHSEGNANHKPITKNQEPSKPTPSAPSEKISLTADGEWTAIAPGQRVLWERAYPALSLDAELAKAAAWLMANPKNKKSNYARFLTNWLSRAQDSARPAPNAVGYSQKPPNRQEALEARNREVAARAAERLTLEFDHANH